MPNVIKTSSPNLTYLTETNNFLTATGITDSIQSMAINGLIQDFMNFGIWTKCFAIYPIIGGTAATHKFNLKNPADTDAAFRMVFSGTIVHSATGMRSTASGFGDTKFVPSTSGMSLNDAHISFYAGTTQAFGTIEMGCSSSGTGPFTLIQAQYINGHFYGDINQTTEDGILNSTPIGWFMTARSASNAKAQYVNGKLVLSSSVASTSLPNRSIYLLGSNNNGTLSANTSKECRFATIGSNLTAVDAANMYTAIQKFNGYLNRSIY